MQVCTLRVTREIQAPAETLFDLWMNVNEPGGPWFGAKKLLTRPCVDGLFFLAVEHEGRIWPHYGRFLEIQPPHRIAYTWVSESTRGLETVVVVTFETAEKTTHLTLTQENVPDDEEGRKHEQGWSWMLDVIAQRYNSPGPL